MLFLYNHSPLLLSTLDTWMLHIGALHLVINVKLLKRLLQCNGDLYGLALAFLDRFPMTCFVTKATTIIIIDLHVVSVRTIDSISIVELLLKMIRTCLTSHKDPFMGRYTHIFTLWTKAISRDKLYSGKKLACAWF